MMVKPMTKGVVLALVLGAAALAVTVNAADARVRCKVGKELDSDCDGLSNRTERRLGTNRRIADTDGDGLSDGAEVLQVGTNPLDADTDGDGLDDGEEVEMGTDPENADTDADGESDGQEVQNGTDPNNPDEPDGDNNNQDNGSVNDHDDGNAGDAEMG